MYIQAGDLFNYIPGLRPCKLVYIVCSIIDIYVFISVQLFYYMELLVALGMAKQMWPGNCQNP